jgi:dTDP-4-amino-4,6-dideoxygalactose transaminase
MFDIQAAMGLVQLDRMGEMQAKRLKVVNLYQEKLAGIKGLTLPEPNAHTTNHCWHLYIIRINEGEFGMSRDSVIEEMNARNIGTSVHFLPVHLMSAYRDKFGCKEGDYPICEQWSEECLSLPLSPTMTEQDALDVIEALREIAKA